MKAFDAEIAAAYVAACDAELDALKPGNAHRKAPHPRLKAADFARSAEASAPEVAARGERVGVRIRRGVEATLAVAGQNTNLGILLLCAPLAAAAEKRPSDLRSALALVLDDLDVQDAADVFAAIVAADPGGLGGAGRHDVRSPALVGLKEAMAEADARDRISRQYVTVFEDVFQLGAPALRKARAAGFRPHWATTAVFLEFLAAWPDTHIVRNFDHTTAESVRREAVVQRDRIRAARDPQDRFEDLLAFDASLKARGINPGTSADLTVATLFADLLGSAGDTDSASLSFKAHAREGK